MTRLRGALRDGCAVLLLSSAAPLYAQLSPTYGYNSPNGLNVVGRVANASGGLLGYGANRQIAINECASAAQVRLDTYGGGRILAISDSSASRDGSIVVRGLASRQYGGSGRVQLPADLSWRCRTDPRGSVLQVTVGPADYRYRPDDTRSDNDYSRLGYRRY